MIKFSKDKVLLLHKLIAEETGGSIGVRDEALLQTGRWAMMHCSNGSKTIASEVTKVSGQKLTR